MSAFRYDIHTHTSETSRCGHIPGAVLVDQYIALGYTGIAVTDHLHKDYIQTLPCKDNWDACVDAYLAGYREAARHAARVTGGAFDVILGMELRYPQDDNDFLVFGIDEDFLRANPYPYRTTAEDFFTKNRDKVFIIQAHPFRHGCHPIDPAFLHGIEVFNGNPRHESRNDLALSLAKENPRLIRTCGSDTHQDGDAGRAAMVFDSPVRDSFELKARLEKNNFTEELPTSNT